MIHEDETMMLSDQSRKSALVESMVQAARTCNKVLTRNTCRLCHVYCDKQVAFEEEVQQRQQSQFDNPMERVWMRTSNGNNVSSSLEVNLYREFLFDEDSVVEGVNYRDQDVGKSTKDQQVCAGGQEDQSTMTQLTG